MEIKRTVYEKIESMIAENVLANTITVESFWEDDILKSNHYGIYDQDILVGYCTIFEKTTITSFYLTDSHAQFGKIVFNQIKHLEEATHAMVPTGDEFFMSHCVDSYARMEKRAYFFTYRPDLPVAFERKAMDLILIESKEDLDLLKKAEDFFDNYPVKNALDKSSHYRIYKVLDQDELVGFGVVETGRVDPSIASIGMYVMADKRQQGYAKNILRRLQELMMAEGYEKIRSGCWYYNHNSKKSIEAAGGYSKTRLLRFYF